MIRIRGPHIRIRDPNVRTPHAHMEGRTSCAYLEWWVIDPQTIEHIRSTWAPVSPPG